MINLNVKGGHLQKKEDTNRLIASRLRQARKELGITQEEVAKAAGFKSHQILLNIEKGTRTVKVAELVRLAKLYERSVDFFFGVDQPKSRPLVIWRDKQDQHAAKRIEQKFLNYCETYARLEELADHKPTAFFLDSEKKIENVKEAVSYGESLGKAMGLGSRPAQELTTVLENRYSVKILILNAGNAGSAASTKGTFGAGILLNLCNSPWRRNYDIAHELFHLTTWEKFNLEDIHCTSDTKKSRIDMLADAFASALLLPGMVVIEEFKNRVKNRSFSYIDCVTIARQFGVSTEALLWRLLNLNQIKKEEAEKAMNSSSLKSIDRTERIRDWKKEPKKYSPRFVTIAFECLQKGRMSRTKFAELMEIDLCDIDKFLANYGYDAAENYEGKISTA